MGKQEAEGMTKKVRTTWKGSGGGRRNKELKRASNDVREMERQKLGKQNGTRDVPRRRRKEKERVWEITKKRELEKREKMRKISREESRKGKKMHWRRSHGQGRANRGRRDGENKAAKGKRRELKEHKRG